MLSKIIQQQWRNAAEGENCIKYVNSYLMNCTMNNCFVFKTYLKLYNLSREINLNCYGVGCLVGFKR